MTIYVARPLTPRAARLSLGTRRLLEIDISARMRDLALRLTRPAEPGVVRRGIDAITLSAYVAPAWTVGRRRLTCAALREVPQVLFGLRCAVAEADWLRLRVPDADVSVEDEVAFGEVGRHGEPPEGCARRLGAAAAAR